MAKLEPVKAEQHKNLKIAAKRDIKHIANQHIVPITAPEFAQGVTSFPIFIVKDQDSDRYRSVAMLGLESGENLLVTKENNWSGIYAPQTVGMVPFALGLDPEKENTLTTCIDVENEFVGEDKELALFDEKGEATDLFKNVEESLGRLYNNEVLTDKFLKEVVELDLLEELELTVSLVTGEQKKIVGLYTINEKKLLGLPEEKVTDFHKRGLFFPMYALLSSVNQIHRLAQLRNAAEENVKVTGIKAEPKQAEQKA